MNFTYIILKKRNHALFFKLSFWQLDCPELAVEELVQNPGTIYLNLINQFFPILQDPGLRL